MFTYKTVSCCSIHRRQKYKSLLGIEILMCISIPFIFSLLPMVSIATPAQKIAQATSQLGVNRPTLKVGSQGEPVSELQAVLKLLGFYTGEVNGIYNESTANAVSQFQQAAGLNPNGIADANTWQRLFPGEPIASSSVSSSNSASNSANKFPAPSSTSNSNVVVVPSREQKVTNTTTTTNRVVNSKPEPKPSTRVTTANSKPEPKPTTTRVVNSKPESKPSTRVATANSQRTSSRQSSSRTRSSTGSQRTTRIQQTARSGSNNRTQQSTRRSSTRTQETAYAQHTSEGFPILRIGMRGSEVTKLQQRLRRLGFLEESNIDGDFGATTEAAVIALQKRYGLEADGVVGGATWEVLMQRRGR